LSGGSSIPTDISGNSSFRTAYQSKLRFLAKTALDMSYAIDPGGGPTIVYKMLRGRIYIVGEIPRVTMADRLKMLDKQA